MGKTEYTVTPEILFPLSVLVVEPDSMQLLSQWICDAGIPHSS